MGVFRRAAQIARDLRVWRLENAKLVYDQLVYRNRNLHQAYTDQDHLLAAVGWLERAQDAMGDGGVGGRYHPGSGWTSSYPETTGYIIPTFLTLADWLGDRRFIGRAERAGEFLLRLQTPDGAFHGGEVAEATGKPSVFNTAQILNGLTSWYRAGGGERVLTAARRAADWLLSVQDPDGAWRKFVYNGVPSTYSAHASCWLAEFGEAIDDRRYLDAAARHVRWVMSNRDPKTGWFDRCGFDTEQHTERVAFTHTIAYTLAGVLYTAERVGDESAIEAVRVAALAIARRLELSKRLPGILDAEWKSRTRSVCLTGNAQMALIWDRLFWITGDGAFLNAALRALDHVKRAQPMRSANPGIRGGIPGSDPIWGEYITERIPNWAAKFFIDALLTKKATLDRLGERPRFSSSLPEDLPFQLPAPNGSAPARAIRSVVVTTAGSDRPVAMLRCWEQFGYKPDAVVAQQAPPASIPQRLRKKIQAEGFGWIRGRARPVPHESPAGESGPDLQRYCAERSITLVRTGPLDSAEGLKALQALQPDLVVQAGAGILRPGLLAIPRLGTINAHMGLLPRYRGMNVAEWAAFHGDQVGCTVHLIDPGIDTGDILVCRSVPTDGATGISELRGRVDQAQLAALGEVLQWVTRTGGLPPGRRQTAEEGVQYFILHPELASRLERELRRRPAG